MTNEQMARYGYGIFNYDGTGMLEIQKLDDRNTFKTDEEAVTRAIKDGIKIIPVNELPWNFDRRYLGWIDTPENRAAIAAYCNEHMPRTAIIIEIDDKGYYSRYALTIDEFKQEFQNKDPDIPDPTENGDSYTLCPLVHMWYKIVEVGDNDWNTFFTDMLWGLPETDIETNNEAYIELSSCLSLRTILEQYINKEI